jgi:catechol 2,3-dioxygenase-like lactoylglutathione lyase family enzyme
VIDHLSIQCADLAASAAFYDAVLGPLGFRRVLEVGGAIGYGADRPRFWLGPVNTGTDDPAREVHIAFTAQTRAAVVAFHEAALASGAESLHAPGDHPPYHPGYYGAFVRDPDGNNVEAVCHTVA